MFRRTRPRRPYTSLREFNLARGNNCLVCHGSGALYTDPPDPVEGYQHARTIACSTCGGSGKGTKESCRQAYQKSLEAYRQEKAEYDRLVRLKKEALKKLTKEEVAAIRELGL